MTMDYISTRGDAPAVGFEQALLKGLAPDGGLYVPRDWPRFSQNELNAFAELDFAAAAARILAPLAAGALSEEQLLEMAQAAFASFDDPAVVAPLFQFGEQDWLMELYHGPTLAFKDVAMQLLGRLFVDVLARRDRRVTIIGATSGDTGAAAIEAFRGQERVDVFILHPAGRVSEVQRRIMTSVEDGNIHNIAIEGSFDDCQRIVKTLLSDKPFAERYALGGVNSINWARLAVQIVYYFTTAASLGRLDLPTSYVVPTGNFGDIFAGYAAKRMGLPVDKLVIAVNENDILHRTLESGVYQSRGVKATNAPSMDIQIASNFERLVYEAGGRDAEAVKAFIEASLSQEGATLAPHALEAIRSDFTSARADEDEIRVPNWTASLGALWQSEARSGFTIGAALDAVGEQDDFDFGSFPSQRVTLDAYVLASATVTYPLTEKVSLTLRGENLFDEEVTDVFGYAQPGAGVFVGLRIN